MERSTPVRKPHTSTADLLTWSEDSPQPDSSAPRSTRPHQPSDGIRKVVFGGQVTDEEFESLNKRKPCSGYKMKEITGSGIFGANGENEESEQGNANPTSNAKTGLRMYQQALAGISHISFAEERVKKQHSEAKCKDLSGHDIFAPPAEILPRPTTVRALALKDNFDMGEPDTRDPAELACQGDIPPGSAEKPLSAAKLREMSGSNIFADGKVESRDYYGGMRKPPGGESSIALV
ncbi:hypothetical protein F3Y22_tig00111394pilonHSYRG00015 [Hibiscus syriacus]|uniref:DUF4057 domain-containing protein n=1 Tax=Hibiscus syriacus TaxID=106335 RepID=A0A6A2XW29_HIBSY|nr:hypothetical protein F3Y22_tig00111394pilonHSYRG00015 [Hibiscus syriacus]